MKKIILRKFNNLFVSFKRVIINVNTKTTIHQNSIRKVIKPKYIFIS